jgi:hypothetical protein
MSVVLLYDLVKGNNNNGVKASLKLFPLLILAIQRSAKGIEPPWAAVAASAPLPQVVGRLIL